MYNNYNTSDVKAHRTILKSDRDKIIYITRNFKSLNISKILASKKVYQY